jgi:gamma-glutamyl-gamma-aminobutyrate hydrolase PuuD
MPILALCGGSWRLVQNYGGSTVELAAIGANGRMLGQGSNDPARLRHAGNMNNVKTEFKHPLSIRSDSMLGHATGRTLLPNTPTQPLPQMQVNSVHWAVVRTASMGTRNGLAPQPFEVVPNNLLTVSAKDPSALNTSEAVESQHGAPVIGVQWHPEYQLPQDGSQQTQSRLANLNLLRWMIEAGRAYRAHRDAMAELLLLTGGGAPKTATGVLFRGAPAHTGATPGAVQATARPIPKHKDDTVDTTNFAKAEMAVRRYLFELGRTDKLFLSPVEVFNLATGAPLPRIHEPEDLKAGPVASFMNANVWAQKYCDGETKKTILAWSKT